MNNDQGGRKTSENDDTCAKGVIKRRKASIASDVKNVGGFPVAVLAATSHKEVEHSAGGRRTQEEEGGTNSLLPLSGGISPSHNNGTSESNGSDAQQERPLSPERALRLYRKRFKRRSSDNGSVPVSHYDHEEEQQKKQFHTTSTTTTSPQRYQHQQVSQQQHYHHQHDDHLIDIPEELLQENNSAESSSPSGLCCQKGQGKGPTEQNQGEPSLLVLGDGSSSTLETAASLRSVAEDSDDSADTPALCPPPTCCGATTSASCSTGSSSGSSSSSTTMLGKRQNMIAALICILFCLSAIYRSAPSKTRDTGSGREFVESSSIEEYSKHNHILVFNDDNDQDPLPHTIIPKNQASPRERKKDNNSDTERQQEERPEENNAAAAAGASIVYAKEQVDRQAIVRGEQVTNAQEEYPYVVSLLQRNWKGQAWHTCGGIMISPNVVLTVAHCEYSVDIVHIGLSRADHNKNRARRRLRGVDDNQFEIKPEGQIFDATGSKPSDSTTSQRRSLSSDGIQLHNLRNNDQFGRAYAVKSWHKIKHPKFNSKTGDYDFMLIKVPGWNEGTPTVRINDDASKPNGVLNEKTVVLGWGVTQTANSRSVSEVLRRASLQVMTNYKCGDMYEKIFSGSPITDRMLCAYSDNGRDACKGDSGGPLIVEHPKYRNKDLAVGLVSWGEECGNVNYPGVYSRISNVHDWITDTVCSKMSPESCLNYEIRRSFSPGEVCKDHVGTFQNSRYRSCSWVKRAKWITCRWYKDLCPVTCDVDKC